MNKEDIVKVTKIVLTADHWCHNCHSDLLDQLTVAFPEFTEEINQTYLNVNKIRKAFFQKTEKYWETLEGQEPNVWEIES